MKTLPAFFACLLCFSLCSFVSAAEAAAGSPNFGSSRPAGGGALLLALPFNFRLADPASQSFSAASAPAADSGRSIQRADQASLSRPSAPAVWPLARIFLAHPQSGRRIFRGTGFLTNKNLVVTNFHILSESRGYDFLIQTISGETLPFRGVRHLSAPHDLAVLEVENSSWPSLALSPLKKEHGDVYMAGFLESGRMLKLKGWALAAPNAEGLIFSEFDMASEKSSEKASEKFSEKAPEPAKKNGMEEYLMFSYPKNMAGFSGSPIVDAKGRAAAVFSGHTGEIAFGIPASKVQELLKEPALPADKPKDDLIAEEIAELFELASGGNAEACQMLGLSFFHGLGMKRDFQLARLWFQKAAEQGFSESQYSLGLMLFQEENLESDAEAFLWFLRAAHNGHARARYQLGLMLSDGLGVRADKKRALRWLELAAGQGLPRAQALAAEMHAAGHGAPKSPEKAFSWFLAAAKSEHAGSQLQAGLMYLQGRGTEKDLERSHHWLRKAAESGESEAQYLLGVMRLQGIYLKKDRELAKAWFLKAAEQGFSKAEEALAELEGRAN